MEITLKNVDLRELELRIDYLKNECNLDEQIMDTDQQLSDEEKEFFEEEIIKIKEWISELKEEKRKITK